MWAQVVLQGIGVEGSLLLIAPFVCPLAEVQIKGTHRTASPEKGHFEFLPEVVERSTRAPGLSHIRNISLANIIVVLYFTPIAPCKKGMFCTLESTKPQQKWV